MREVNKSFVLKVVSKFLNFDALAQQCYLNAVCELKTPVVVFSLFGFPIIRKVRYDSLPPMHAKDHFKRVSDELPNLLSADKADYLAARSSKDSSTAKHLMFICQSEKTKLMDAIMLTSGSLLWIENWANYFHVEHPDD